MKKTKTTQKEEIIKMLDGMNAHALAITQEKVSQVYDFYKSWMDTKTSDSEVIMNGKVIFGNKHDFTSLITSRPRNRKKN